uniref:hypothetical protein n=1 Tax=Lentilactobacillus rapi TaxID=481723 RepID=UPI001FB27707
QKPEFLLAATYAPVAKPPGSAHCSQDSSSKQQPARKHHKQKFQKPGFLPKETYIPIIPA